MKPLRPLYGKNSPSQNFKPSNFSYGQNFAPKIFYVDQCVVKDMLDIFEVVALGYCDEFCHVFIVGNNISSNRNKCVDMVANVNDTIMLWNQCVHPTKYGYL
jgi:hypothetical protein